MAVLARTARATQHRHRLAAIAAFVAVIHLAIAPTGWQQAAYLGCLYVLAGLVAGAVAIAAWRADPAADGVAVTVGIAYAAAYVVSRVVGLPGVPRPGWTWLGAATVVLDIVLVASGGAVFRPASPSRVQR